MIKYISAISLVISNCIPILGVLFFGWDLFSILLLYWSETAIIGVFSIIKISYQYKKSALFLVPFFMVHFGLFMFGHLIFIVQIFAYHYDASNGKGLPIPDLYPILSNSSWLILPFALLFISHFISFIINYINKKEYLNKNANSMFAPYGRVVIMHLSIMFGGLFSQIFHNNSFSLIILVVLKTTVDLISHNLQHKTHSNKIHIVKANI